MAGRALVFSHPEVVALARERFIPYAGDQWYLRRREDPEGEFFWHVAQQGHNRNRPENQTRQGIYFAAPDGHLFSSFNSRSAERALDLMRRAVREWETRELGEVAAAARPLDPRFERDLPEGGLVARVFSRIPLAGAEEWTTNQAVGRDHLWLTREEGRSLLPERWEAGHAYPLPAAVAERLARFHLVDNVRGEPPMWSRGNLREAEFTLTVADPAAGTLSLHGSARLEAPAGNDLPARGYHARLQGVLRVDRERRELTQLDLLAWGEAWGRGRYTGGAPPGRFPLVIAFTLAPDDPGRIPPQAARDFRGYFNTGR